VFGTGTAPTGTGDMNVDVTFVNAAGHDYHLAPASVLKDMANPQSTLANDFDGNPRPQGNARDIGADELMP
jgi:hypothetical protein